MSDSKIYRVEFQKQAVNVEDVFFVELEVEKSMGVGVVQEVREILGGMVSETYMNHDLPSMLNIRIMRDPLWKNNFEYSDEIQNKLRKIAAKVPEIHGLYLQMQEHVEANSKFETIYQTPL